MAGARTSVSDKGLALGQFRHQDEILERMLEMPQAMMADTFEVLKFIEENALI
jgi:uncharacterized Fe-S radical SAM superfamily protein PflX